MATPKRQTETALQMAVVRWARQNVERWPAAAWMFHAANEGKVDPREAGKRKSLGVVAGVSDLLLLARSGPYSGLCLELKRKPNRLTQEQRNFFSFVESQGYKTAVAYTLEEAQTIITDYLQGMEAEAS